MTTREIDPRAHPDDDGRPRLPEHLRCVHVAYGLFRCLRMRHPDMESGTVCDVCARDRRDADPWPVKDRHANLRQWVRDGTTYDGLPVHLSELAFQLTFLLKDIDALTPPHTYTELRHWIRDGVWTDDETLSKLSSQAAVVLRDLDALQDRP